MDTTTRPGPPAGHLGGGAPAAQGPAGDPGHPAPHRTSAYGPRRLVAALPAALRKLDPRHMVRRPVMFLVEAGAVLTTVLAVAEVFTGPRPSGGSPVPDTFTAAIAAWLWFTVVFANLAESVAEGRGKAQAASLRATRTDTPAVRVRGYDAADPAARRARTESVAAADLVPADVVVVSAGGVIPGDGDVVHGIASVDESAITGESAPVVREAGGDGIAHPVRLTPTEWAVLEVLVRNEGRLVSRQQLLTKVWGTEHVKDTGYLRLYLSQLRKKLEPQPAAPRHLLTEPGMGYRFTTTPEAAGPG